MRRRVLFLVTAWLLHTHAAGAQTMTGAVIGTVKDAQGGVLQGATVRVSSPALIGGPATMTTNDQGQLRFPALPPGPYVLDVEARGFTAYREEHGAETLATELGFGKRDPARPAIEIACSDGRTLHQFNDALGFLVYPDGEERGLVHLGGTWQAGANQEVR